MELDDIIMYAPLILLISMFFIKNRLFVTPEQLEKKHREILRDVELKYTTVDTFHLLEDQVTQIHTKIDKIYELLIK
jgi:hypothetical protein